MGMSTNELLIGGGVLAAILVVFGGGFTASGVSDQVPMPSGDSGNSVETGVSATLSLSPYDYTAESDTQVGATQYVWETSGEEEFFLGEKAGDAQYRTDFSVVTGDSFKAIAFNSQYPYGVVAEGDVEAETVRENLDVYEGAATSDVALTVNDENGDATTGLGSTLGSEEQYQFQGVEVAVENSNVAFNPAAITVGYPDSVDNVEMPGAEKINTPETAENTVNAANEVTFVPQDFNPQQTPQMSSWDEVSTSSLVVEASTAGTASGDALTIALQDEAPFITQSNSLEFGIEDDASNPTDAGVGAITTEVALS